MHGLICSPLGRQIKKIKSVDQMGSFIMPKKSFSPDVKILVLQHLEEDRHTLEEICMMFSVNMTTLYAWRALYKYGGVEAFAL